MREVHTAGSRRVPGKFPPRAWRIEEKIRGKISPRLVAVFDVVSWECDVTSAFAFVILVCLCAGRWPGYVDRGAEKVHK